MSKLNNSETLFIGLVLEGFFYGLYSGIFSTYLQYQALKKVTNKTQKIISCSICVLYILSGAVVICDITLAIYQLQILGKPQDSILPIYLIQITLFGCCDFIAQFILIYRCWIVWGCDIRVVIIPSILAFAFLVTWISYGGSYFLAHQSVAHQWGPIVIITGLSLSLIVNALVMGLIVWRIFKVFREVKATSVPDATGGNKLRRTMFILIESGMVLFAVQLIRLMVTVLARGALADKALLIIVGIHQIFNGITPTIILVGISMGLSFDDEKSTEEVAIGSLRFAPHHHPNSVPEVGSIGIVNRDSRDDDNICIQRSNDIDIVYG